MFHPMWNCETGLLLPVMHDRSIYIDAWSCTLAAIFILDVDLSSNLTGIHSTKDETWR